MQKLLVIACCVLALVACKGDKKSDAPAGGTTAALPKGGKGMPTAADCDSLGKKTSKQSMEMTPPGTSDADRAKLQVMSDEAGAAIAELCKTDSWSGEAVACGLSAKNPAVECKGKLTDAQVAAMEARVQAIFTKGMQGLSGSQAPAGSTTPAGSGSAAP
jgi:hypothetical protein